MHGVRREKMFANNVMDENQQRHSSDTDLAGKV
jgi:hypothetical protein